MMVSRGLSTRVGVGVHGRYQSECVLDARFEQRLVLGRVTFHAEMARLQDPCHRRRIAVDHDERGAVRGEFSGHRFANAPEPADDVMPP
jgi:hypothetical protein